MAYATAAHVQNALGAEAYLALADRDGDGAADTQSVEQALENASGFADSYIARFLPLATTPDALRQAVIDIAVYRLANEQATEEQRSRYEDAVRWLRDVASGRASLGEPSVDAEVDDDVVLDGPTAVMSRAETGGLL